MKQNCEQLIGFREFCDLVYSKQNKTDTWIKSAIIHVSIY